MTFTDELQWAITVTGHQLVMWEIFWQIGTSIAVFLLAFGLYSLIRKRR